MTPMQPNSPDGTPTTMSRIGIVVSAGDLLVTIGALGVTFATGARPGLLITFAACISAYSVAAVLMRNRRPRTTEPLTHLGVAVLFGLGAYFTYTDPDQAPSVLPLTLVLAAVWFVVAAWLSLKLPARNLPAA